MRARQHVCFGAMLIAVGGCGAAAAPAPPPAAPPAVAEPEPVAEEPAPEPEPPPPPAVGPATVTITATVKGEPVAATVRLLGSDGAAVAEGPAGQALRVDSGDYDLEVQVTDEKALVDKPTQRRGLTLAAGDEVAESVEFPWARVQLNVRVNGNPDKNAVVRILRDGQLVTQVKSGAPHVGISPGRYKAQVKTRGATIDVDQLMFPAGATQGVPVNVQF